jgi:hypothetical protein
MIDFGLPLNHNSRLLVIRALRDEWAHSSEPNQSLALSILDQMVIEHTEADPYAHTNQE